MDNPLDSEDKSDSSGGEECTSDGYVRHGFDNVQLHNQFIMEQLEFMQMAVLVVRAGTCVPVHEPVFVVCTSDNKLTYCSMHFVILFATELPSKTTTTECFFKAISI